MAGPLTRILDAIRTAGLLVVQIVGSLRYNWGIGLLSLGLAISLWVFVTDRENPEECFHILLQSVVRETIGKKTQKSSKTL